jgi:hypothetical protein
MTVSEALHNLRLHKPPALAHLPPGIMPLWAIFLQQPYYFPDHYKLNFTVLASTIDGTTALQLVHHARTAHTAFPFPFSLQALDANGGINAR